MFFYNNPPTRRTGRPRFPIDWSVLDALCSVRCTAHEIAAQLRCSVDTVERAVRREKGVTLAEYREQLGVNVIVSLRRRQIQMALAGNVTMLIFLGKAMLGQTDRVSIQQETTGADGGPVELNVAQRVAGRIAGMAERLAEGRDNDQN